MSPRTGRPTADPKMNKTQVRLSDADKKKLDYCCAVLELTKAEVIRQGIETMYQKALKKE